MEGFHTSQFSEDLDIKLERERTMEVRLRRVILSNIFFNNFSDSTYFDRLEIMNCGFGKSHFFKIIHLLAKGELFHKSPKAST